MRMRRGLSLGLVCTIGVVQNSFSSCAIGQKPVYMTFDTGSQSQAELIRQVLKKYDVKASFFLANEKTVNGDYSLDTSWAPYWKALVTDGHAFGTHTFDHVYFKSDIGANQVKVQPQFGRNAGKTMSWTGPEYCTELNRAKTRFKELTGAELDPFWRAPGGKTSPRLIAMGTACGYHHFGWTDAGFLGDELPSEKYSNPLLLQRALNHIRPGDIVMAHLGIWSRKDAFAPMLDPLIAGLKQKGYCFATLREYPLNTSAAKP